MDILKLRGGRYLLRMAYLDSSPVNLRFLAEGILDSKLMSDNYTLDIGRE